MPSVGNYRMSQVVKEVDGKLWIERHSSQLFKNRNVILSVKWKKVLMITSPGGMVEGLPIQKRDLYHIASRRRNPYLADIFHRLQLMERSGSGIKEIMNDYKASANITEDRLPTFFSDESDFNVTFWNLNYGVEQSESKGSNREVSDKVSDKSIGNANLSDTEKQILSYISKNSNITQKELASQLGISEIGIRKAMAQLKKNGIIIREGSPKKGSWKVTN